MNQMHDIFSKFQEDFPEIHELQKSLGKQIHEKGGPLDEKSRWLVKISISAAGNHKRALKTHLRKAKQAGLSDEEIKHALLLLIQTAGFPAFMKAYSIFRSLG